VTVGAKRLDFFKFSQRYAGGLGANLILIYKNSPETVQLLTGWILTMTHLYGLSRNIGGRSDCGFPRSRLVYLSSRTVRSELGITSPLRLVHLSFTSQLSEQLS
jgi:hypothetical protein